VCVRVCVCVCVCLHVVQCLCIFVSMYVYMLACARVNVYVPIGFERHVLRPSETRVIGTEKDRVKQFRA
jgi:hypothetical protein